LLKALETIEPLDETGDALLRFPVQLIVRPGAGTDFRGYAGRVESGALVQGAEVVVLPSGRRTAVRDIVTLEGSRTAAVAGDSVTLLLRDELDISRGDVLADPAHPPRIAKTVEAIICWLAAEPLQPTGRYLLKHTTRIVRVKLLSLSYRMDMHTLDEQPAPSALEMNDIARVAFALQQPIFVDRYSAIRVTGAFVLIDEASNQTVAAGMIE